LFRSIIVHLTNSMNCTKNLDTSIALACNHCGILCIELHILYPPSCQDKPKLPSSVNTWDGLLLTTQPLGSCWCACWCGLWIDVPSDFSSIERPSTLAGGAKKLGCLLANGVPPTSIQASILAMAKIIISWTWYCPWLAMCQEYPKHEIYIASDYQISCSVLAWFCRLMEATAHRRDISPANFVGVICIHNSWRYYRYDIDVGAVWKVYNLNHSVVVWFAHLHHLGFQPTPPNLGKHLLWY